MAREPASSSKNNFYLSRLTLERVREVLSYSLRTGLFKWERHRNRDLVGKTAGYDSLVNGYIVIRIDGANVYAHRLVFFYLNGVWPKVVDHKNRIRTDNRWSNLREVTQTTNNQNRVFSGVRVKDRPSEYPFFAMIAIPGKRREKRLGNFKTAEEAHQAYLQAKIQLHPGYIPPTNED